MEIEPGCDPVPVVPARLDWPSAIGNFLLQFGYLEGRLTALLEAVLPAPQFERARRLHFNDRVAEVNATLDRLNFSVELRQEFDQFRNGIGLVRELRNHVAHGFLTIHIQRGHETEVTVFNPIDTGRELEPETRRLSFRELRNALDELNRWINEFDDFSSRVWAELPRRKSKESSSEYSTT